MLLYLFLALGLAQQIDIDDSCVYPVGSNRAGQKAPSCIYSDSEEIARDDGDTDTTTAELRIRPDLTAHFSEKFQCRHDKYGAYYEWAKVFYPTDNCNQDATTLEVTCNQRIHEFYCCGIMANGRKQCDRMDKWKKVGDSHFTLCETSYADAYRETTSAGSTVPKLRRDLCCENDEFQDCNLCKSFMVWDFTVDDQNGGDPAMEDELKLDEDNNDATVGKVTLDEEWRTRFEAQQGVSKSYQPPGNADPVFYPPYAYDNGIYPAGFARAMLREFNDPPVCVYAPNLAGRVIEIRVEPEESGSNVCVDDLHEDSLERNTPGVTQACDDSRLQTCFPDADPREGSNGFAFLISCSESCADGDLDLWFRIRASVMKWTENGDQDKGTTDTEVATEMWCMWGNQDMRDDENQRTLPEAFPESLDGNFARWDVYPSDLTPPEAPVVRPADDGTLALSIGFLVSMLALFF